MMLPAKQLAAAVTTVTQVQELKQVVKSSLWLGCSQCSYSVFCSNEGHLYRKREYQIRVLVAGYVIPSKFYTLQNWRHIFFFRWGSMRVELSSWKVRRLAQLRSPEGVWIVQHVLSVCFRRIERLRIVSETNVDPHMQRTKLRNWKFEW